MPARVSYEDGHLVVAAVRVLGHRSGKPPTPEEVADLVDMPAEFIRNVAISLGEEGILKVLENPFEIRLEIADHMKLETLPRKSEKPSIGDEIDEFLKKRKEKVKETEKMLSLEELEKRKKEKLAKLEEEMRKMKGKPKPPFLD